MPSAQRNITSNIFYLTTGQTLSWLLAAVEVLVVPRYLGPSSLGILTLIASLGALIGVISTFGTQVFILREVARDPVKARKLVGPAVILYIVMALICWIIAATVINFFQSDSTIKIVLYFIAIANILGLSISPLRAALQGMDKMYLSLVEAVLYKGLGTLLSVIVVIFNLGIIVLVANTLIITVPLIIIYWWVFSRHSSTKLTLDPVVYRTLIRGGTAFLVLDISYNGYLYLDSLLLSILTTQTVVGYYGVPMKLLGSLLIFPVIIGQAVLPSLSRLYLSEQESSRDISNKTLTFLVCISLPMAVGTTVLAEPFIKFFYGDQFAASIPALIILGWTAVPMYLGIGLYQILTAQNKQNAWAKIMIMACFVNLVLNLILISYFQQTTGNGSIGAAISLLLTELVIGLIGLRTSRGQIATKRIFIALLKSLIIALLMGIVIWPLKNLWLPIPVLAGLLIYGVGAIILFNLNSLISQIIFNMKQRVNRLIKQKI